MDRQKDGLATGLLAAATEITVKEREAKQDQVTRKVRMS